MASMNKVILAGNLTRDVEVKTLASGMMVANMGLAVSRKYRTKDGKEAVDTLFADIVVWGKQAENCDRFLHKGDPILIDGRLQYEEWTDKETGKKRNKLRVVGTNVQFLSSRRHQNEEDEMESRENNGIEAHDNSEEESENL